MTTRDVIVIYNQFLLKSQAARYNQQSRHHCLLTTTSKQAVCVQTLGGWTNSSSSNAPRTSRYMGSQNSTHTKPSEPNKKNETRQSRYGHTCHKQHNTWLRVTHWPLSNSNGTMNVPVVFYSFACYTNTDQCSHSLSYRAEGQKVRKRPGPLLHGNGMGKYVKHCRQSYINNGAKLYFELLPYL